MREHSREEREQARNGAPGRPGVDNKFNNVLIGILCTVQYLVPLVVRTPSYGFLKVQQR